MYEAETGLWGVGVGGSEPAGEPRLSFLTHQTSVIPLFSQQIDNCCGETMLALKDVWCQSQYFSKYTNDTDAKKHFSVDDSDFRSKINNFY